MHPETERYLPAALRPLRVSWSLMLAASLAWAVLGLFASPVASLAESAAGPALRVALAALGFVCALATIVIELAIITPRRMAALIPAPEQELVQRHLLAGHLVLWSFAVLPAFFGFAQLLLGGAPGTHLALAASSLALLALLLPTRSRIATRVAAVLAVPAAQDSRKTRRSKRKSSGRAGGRPGGR